MEIDQLKSAPTEDQMEMMMMMDKLPIEFFDAYNDVAHDLAPPSTEFPTATSSNDDNIAANAITNFLDNPHVSSSSHFLNPPSAMTFGNENSPNQESPPHLQPFLSNPRWRGNIGELPGVIDAYSSPSQKKNSMAAMREMIFRIAAMQPIHIDPESVKPPKRRNVKISKDPQSIAARHRRERISERIRILQRLVPGGTKMDTASMLDEAIHYVKFLKNQVQSLERAQASRPSPAGIGFPVAMSSGNYLPIGKGFPHQPPSQNVQHYRDT